MDPKHSHGPDRVDYQETSGDLTEVHAALLREHPEPTAQVTPIPMWLTVTCGVAVCWAGLYLGFFNGGLRGDVFNELTSNASLLFPAPGKTGPAVAEPEKSLAEQGKANYATCQACHQATGSGTPGTVPPLAGSPFVNGSEKRLAAIMLKGLKGPVTVHGATFNSAMPAWEGQMNNKKLASIATYIRSSFGNNAPPITEAQFAAARKEFEAHKDQMTEAEVLAIPEDATLPGGEEGGGTNSAVPATSTGGAPPANGAPLPLSAPGAPTGAPAVKPPAGAPSPAAPNAPAPGASAPAAPAAAGGPASAEQLAMGKTVYMTICMACHQPTGAGLFPAFPPLTKSPYVSGPPNRLVAMILKGNNPPMTIDGKVYAAVPMPGQEAALNDEKVAAVATYVRANFGNTGGPVTKEQVAAVRAKFADRKTPWMQAELDAWKE
jgi:mono/diheme cytochrome c family protein